MHDVIQREQESTRFSFGAKLTLVGAVMVVIAVVGGIVIDDLYARREDGLTPYPGRVVGWTDGDIRVRFFDRDNERREAVIDVDVDHEYNSGDAVTVLVDPDHLSDVTVQGEAGIPDWLIVPLVYLGVPGLLFVVLGAAGTISSRRM